MESTQLSVSRLRAVRESQRRTLDSVAVGVGISPGHLSRIERGLKRPSLDVLLRIGRELGLKDLVESVGLFVHGSALVLMILALAERRLLDAKDLQGPEYRLSRAGAYEVLREVGVRIGQRRLVVLRDRLESYLSGEGRR